MRKAKSSPPGIRLGLDRVRRALELLGHPEDDFAAVLVAGTNGKGSVSAMTESVLHCAGYRTGLFTSPHLVDVRERVRVDGREISAPDWARLLRRVRGAARRGRVGLTEFETEALVAFLHFREKKVEIAVVEVGLGGRLDATNALPAPEATAITSIGHDHLEWLGPTLKDVFREKAAISRPGIPCFQSLSGALRGMGRRFCRERLVPGRWLPEHAAPSFRRRDWKRLRQVFDVRLPGATYRGLEIPLLGPHQLNNAALAVGLCDALRRRGWRLSETHVRRGLASVRWPGRFQVVKGRGPLLILDGAHNPEGVESLVESYRSSPWGDRTATLIFGCLRDKDARGMIRRLRPWVHRVLAVPLPSPRGRSVEELCSLWRTGTPVRPCGSFAEAWKEARKEPGGPVLAVGSLYLVGEALRALRCPVFSERHPGRE